MSCEEEVGEDEVSELVEDIGESRSRDQDVAVGAERPERFEIFNGLNAYFFRYDAQTMFAFPKMPEMEMNRMRHVTGKSP